MKTNSIYACAFWTNRIDTKIICITLALLSFKRKRKRMQNQNAMGMHIHIVLFIFRLESIRSLTIWFIATYIFRFDCLCSIKFADKIQSKCSNIVVPTFVSHTYSLLWRFFVRVDAKWASLVLVSCYKNCNNNNNNEKTSANAFKDMHFERVCIPLVFFGASLPSSIFNRWKCNIDKNKSKLWNGYEMLKKSITQFFMIWNMRK